MRAKPYFLNTPSASALSCALGCRDAARAGIPVAVPLLVFPKPALLPDPLSLLLSKG